MRKFDRMEWPRRYKLKGSVLALVALAIAFGFWLQMSANQKLQKEIEISELNFDRWGSQYIELSFTIENKSNQDKKVMLLAKVWDKDEEELASALFEVKLKAKTRHNRSKLFDRLNRSLKEGEKPFGASVSVYPRRSL